MKRKELTIGYRARTPNRFPSLNLPLKFGSRLMKIKIIGENCNLWKKFSGLMFSRRENSEILIFSFKRKQKIAIHSFFVYYPFIAVWLDEKNKITDIKIVKPFTSYAAPRKKSLILVEIPINKKNKNAVKFFSPVVKMMKK